MPCSTAISAQVRNGGSNQQYITPRRVSILPPFLVNAFQAFKTQ